MALRLESVDFITVASLVCKAANILRSSIYNKSVILEPIGLDSLYPSVAFNIHATGFIHRVNSLGQSASPWGNSLLNLITSDVSAPLSVLH